MNEPDNSAVAVQTPSHPAVNCDHYQHVMQVRSAGAATARTGFSDCAVPAAPDFTIKYSFGKFTALGRLVGSDFLCLGRVYRLNVIHFHIL